MAQHICDYLAELADQLEELVSDWNRPGADPPEPRRVEWLLNPPGPQREDAPGLTKAIEWLRLHEGADTRTLEDKVLAPLRAYQKLDFRCGQILEGDFDGTSTEATGRPNAIGQVLTVRPGEEPSDLQRSIDDRYYGIGSDFREAVRVLRESSAILRAKSKAPPSDLLLDLTSEVSGLESRILRYLWDRRKAHLNDLVGPDKPWRDALTPDGQSKAIRRLSNRLLEINAPITLSINNEIVSLERPPDK